MFKRTTAILGTAAIVAISFVPAATATAAEQPKLDPYGAGAIAKALDLTLLGQDLAVSSTTAAISSKPEAKADGAALLLAGTPIPGAAPSAAPGGAASNNACVADINLSDLTGGAISLADAGLACVTTTAVTGADKTEATSGSGELVINVMAPGGTILKPLLEPLFDTVTQVTDPLLVALRPLTGVVTDLTKIDLETVLNGLLDDLQDEDIVLAQIAVAPTASVARATTVDGVLAQAGSTIKVLPGLAQSLVALGLDLPGVTQPLATVKVGASKAIVTRDPVTGKAAPDASTATILDVQLDDTLGILQQLTGVASGAVQGLATGPLGCNAGNPLAGVLCIDLGTVKQLTPAELKARNLDFGEGTVGREATAASIHVLAAAAPALGGDVLGLQLASSTAAANATPAAAPPVETAKTPLPKTGGEVPLGVGLGLFALAGAASVLVRRSHTV